MPLKPQPIKLRHLLIATEECTNYIDELCDDFWISKSKKPTLIVLDHSGVANYDHTTRTISVSYDHHYGRLGAAVHEFAHFLASSRRPFHNHDAWFYDWLIACVDSMYFDISKYPWGNEYISLQIMAIKDGYHFNLTKPYKPW